MRTFKLLAVALAAAVGPGPAGAEEIGAEATLSSTGTTFQGAVEPRFSGGLFLGGGLLSDDVELGNSPFDDQVPGSGLLIGARAGYVILPSLAPKTEINPRLSIEVEGVALLSSTDSAGGRSSAFAPVLGWRTHALVDLWPQAQLVPFVLTGIGGETVFGSRNFMHTPDTDFTWHSGVGGRYALTDRLALRSDLRFGLTAGRDDFLAPVAELHVGVAYQFGNKSPAISKKVIPKEVVDTGPVDTDSDGIVDSEDRCPEEAELFNEVDDEDGCPEVDSDGDGLLGSADQCPAAAEDADGHDDEDGCPDLDNDGDGIPDVDDKCPLEAETANNYQDDDGCPDEIPEAVQGFTGAIEGIRFKTGSARILQHSKKTLDAAVNVLVEHPAIRIEVSGHTDSTGSRDANMLLSQKRADYVKWYLVDKGVAADRIETVGHGPDKPVADNETAAGRAKNRRIEFRLLSRPAPASQPTVPAGPTTDD